MTIDTMAKYGKILEQLITDRRFKKTNFSERSGINRSDVYRAINSAEGNEVDIEVLDAFAPLLGFKDGHELDEAVRLKAGLPPPANKSLRDQIRKIETEGNSPEYLAAVTPLQPTGRVRLIPGGDEIAAGTPILQQPDFDHGNDHHFLPGELFPWDDGAFFVRIKGYSMEPDFKDGDVLIGSPALSDQLEGGDCACIRFTPESRFKGSVTFKRIRYVDGDRVRLESLNRAVEAANPIGEVPMSDIAWMGPAVVHIRHLWRDAGYAVNEIPAARRLQAAGTRARPEDHPQKFPDYDGPQNQPDTAPPTSPPPLLSTAQEFPDYDGPQAGAGKPKPKTKSSRPRPR